MITSDIENAKFVAAQITQELLDCNYGEIEEDMYNVLVKYVGVPFIINYKRKKDYDLSDKELDYMVSCMNKIDQERAK